MLEESEIWIGESTDDPKTIVLDLKIPRYDSEDYNELSADAYNFIEELAKENNIDIAFNISMSTDFSQSIDEQEFGEEINLSDYSEDDDYYDEFKEERLTIHSEDDVFADLESGDEYEDFDDSDYGESEYEPDEGDLVDFFGTENTYARINDSDIRRSMGAYDDY